MHFKPTDGTLDIAPISGFLELFEKSCIETKDGETQLNAESLAKEKILYIRKK
jgi:hypothetical protein